MIVLNFVIILTLIFFVWQHYTTTKIIKLDYKMAEENIDNLVKRYQDSTSSSQYKYSWNEVTDYAMKLDNDSLVSFVIKQASRTDYFVRYEEHLRENLGILEYKVRKNESDYLILLMIMIFSVLSNFVMYYFVRSSS